MAIREKVVSASAVRNVRMRSELKNRYKRMLEPEKRSCKEGLRAL